MSATTVREWGWILPGRCYRLGITPGTQAP
jgi:hypothetical protein